MPKYVAAAAMVVGAFYPGTWIAFAAVAVSAAASYVDYRQQQKKAQNATKIGQADRLVMGRASNAPDWIIYGRTRVAPQTIAYMCSHGYNNQYLTMVLPICRHEIDGVEEIYFNDERITVDSNGYATAGNYRRVRPVPITDQATYTGPGQVINLGFLPVGGQIDSIGYRQNVTLAGRLESSETLETVHRDGQVTGTLTAGTDYVLTPGTSTLTILNVPLGVVADGPAGFAISDRGAISLSINYRIDNGFSLARVKVFRGIPGGERDTELEAASTKDGVQEWTADHIGRNVARVHVTLRYDNDVFGQSGGVPNITLVVRGKRVWNPATGATQWLSNAAACTLDYLRSEFGVTTDRIHMPSAVAAFWACAEEVPYYKPDGTLGTEPRYLANGVLSTSNSRIDNLKTLYGAMAGGGTFSGGMWRIYPGVYSSPVATLTEHDLAEGGVTITPRASRRDLFNCIRGQFIDREQAYQQTDFPPYVATGYVTQDGGEYWSDVTLPLTSNAYAAQRIAKLMLFKARLSMVVSGNFRIWTRRLQPGDVIRLKHDRYGFTGIDSGLGKLFRVTERKLNFQTVGEAPTVDLVLQEESPDVYAWTYAESSVRDPAPKTALPNPTVVPYMRNMRAYSGPETFDRLSDGTTVIPYARLQWSPVVDQGLLDGGWVNVFWKRSYDTEYKLIQLRPSDDPNLSQTKLYPVGANDVLNIYTQLVNGLGVVSRNQFLTHRVAQDVARIGYQGGSLPTSKNWLTNPGFVDGPRGWDVYSGGPDEVTFTGLGTTSIAAARIRQEGGTSTSQTSSIRADMDVPTYGGFYSAMLAYVSVISVNCTAQLQLQWIDSSGAMIGMKESEISPNRSASQTAYSVLAVQDTAPANANSARFVLVKRGAITSGVSFVTVFQPFLGPAMEDGSMPPWDSGVALPTMAAINTLRNASFQYSVSDWAIGYVSGASPGTGSITKDPSPMAGDVGNARVSYTVTSGAVSGAVFEAVQSRITVEGGKTYAFYAGLIPQNCNATAFVRFYAANGSFISMRGAGLVNRTVVPAAPTLTDYVRIGSVVSAPLTAATASLHIQGNSAISTTPSVSICQPFFGMVDKGRTSLPGWNVGQNGQVNTDQIADGAFYRSFTATRDSIRGIVLDPSPIKIQVNIPTDDSARNCTVHWELTGSIVATPGTDLSGPAWYAFAGGNTSSFLGKPTIGDVSVDNGAYALGESGGDQITQAFAINGVHRNVNLASAWNDKTGYYPGGLSIGFPFLTSNCRLVRVTLTAHVYKK